MKRRFALAATIAATLAAAPALSAWPEKPVRVIVPFGPGGTSDILARNAQRVIEEKKLLPQPIVIQNVSGHFSVGARQALTAPPDGYNFLVIHLALMSGEIVDPRRGLSYRDFAPVALTGGFCLHPIVRQDSPYKSLKDLLDAAKDKPGTIVTGVNIGALNHMLGVSLEQAYPGAKFRFAQVGGGGENYAAIMGGHTQATVLSSSEYQTYKANGIRALAYSGPRRLVLEPDVPTLKELGLNIEFCIENLWFAPKNTPQAAIDGLADALEKVMATDEIKAFLEKQAQTGQFMRGEAYRTHLDAVFKSIEPVARAAAPQQ